MTTEAELVREAEVRIAALYGVPLHHAGGVVHVASVWTEAGQPRVIRIGPAAPPCATDRFVLDLARARADAIVLTGRILRDEPELAYTFAGESAASLSAWRRVLLGKRDPPRIVVLTSGRAIDFTHPTFRTATRPLVFTSNAARLDPPPHVELVRVPEPSLHAAIAWLRRDGATTITIEAGPSTALALWDDPVVVDELMLSVYEGSLHPSARGLPFLAPFALAARARCVASTRRDESSGSWRFERWLTTRGREPPIAGRDP